MPVGSGQISAGHYDRNWHGCSQRTSDSNSRVGCDDSALDRRSPLVLRGRIGKSGNWIAKLAEVSIAFILDHDTVPDGSRDSHIGGNVLPRAKLVLGMALEGLE